MANRIAAVAFDTVETLFDIEVLRDDLQKVGLPPDLLHPWYSQFVRDGVILTAMGVYQPMDEVAIAALRQLAADEGFTISQQQAEQVIAGFSAMPAHLDTRPALERLNQAGVQVGLLSNGSKSNSQKLLQNAGLTPLVQHVMSIDDVKAWKPAAQVYQFAADTFAVPPRNVALVAAHAWDCYGAQQAGLVSGWRPRRQATYDPVMGTPDVFGNSLLDVVEELLRLP